MNNYFNPCRLYSLEDEGGLIICEWPEDRYKPEIPLTYAEETMTGFEYQAAVHMIQEGLVDKGLEIVKTIRQRFDGEIRNPWNEFECGNNYARSMASFALLPAYSGFEYDMVEKLIGFDPVDLDNGDFNCFWSLDSGWGKFTIKDKQIELEVLYGELEIEKLKLPFIENEEIKSINNNLVKFEKDGEIIKFAQPVKIEEGNILVIEV